MSTFTASVELTTVNCGCCGGTYAIQERYRDKCQEEGKSWTCPYCKCWWGFSGNSENVKLKRRLTSVEQQLSREQSEHDQTRAELTTTERRRRAAKGQLTKTRNSISRGICPCCNNHFKNLQEHMEAQHPEYTDETED